MPRRPWQAGRNWPWPCSYAWAPGGRRPAGMGRFRAWAYDRWHWLSGDVYWLALFKPATLRAKYDYWRTYHAV